MSLRLAALNLGLRLIVKPQLGRMTDPVAARAGMEAASQAWLDRPPRVVPVWRDLGGVPALSARNARGVPGDAAVLFLHGGAYATGSPTTHWPLYARLARLSGIEHLAPDYRLAPEAPFPAALEDAEAAWRGLITRGIEPGRIVLAGDSAGGGLALALLARLCAAGTPPAGLVAFSPWTDLTGAGASLAENAARDPMLPAGQMQRAVDLYLQGAAPDDPGASPLYAAFPGCPPVHLQHAETEILRDDTLRMADRLRSFGAEVTVQSWPDAPHVWHMFHGWIPEARDAIEDAAAAIRRMLSR